MKLLAIDPGPETCGVVLLDVDQWPPTVLSHRAKTPVADVLTALRSDEQQGVPVACERCAPYGKRSVGAEVFETCEIFGDIRATCRDHGIDFTPIFRREVKMRLGLQVSVGDPQVNEVVRLTYPATGGGKTPQKGTKARPGPLYGLADDSWAALGVGLAWVLERERERRAADLERLKASGDATGPLFDSTLQSTP